MKYVIILGDGMADEPIGELGNKTPLQVARTPAMDRLAQRGCSGMLQTIPAGMQPGSEIANLAVLGYDVKAVFEGRGVLEAASIGVDIAPGDLALRCNLVCIEEGKIKNHSAGHITTEEAAEIIAFLSRTMGNEMIRFYPGVSYRHLLVIGGGSKHLDCTPPHDVMGTPFRQVLVRPQNGEARKTASLLNYLIARSRSLLEEHPVNQKRKAGGKDPATCIWPWSPGYRPQMPTLQELYGIGRSAVISAVDLIQGIGVYAGMEVIKVKGATGLYDTNYEGKARATIDALRNHDLVYLHVEASDEAGHEGNPSLKVKTIENLDQRVVKPIMEACDNMEESVTIALLPDHPTPCAIRTHTRDAVPFVIYTPGREADGVIAFDEFSAQTGGYGLLSGNEFMKTLLRR
ncbi:MAG: cofactor-independent phosphoglycerate mutase [Prolixibacteraceae bacterium]|jgi:2,3-bisphosphoglycerate-independent phosphoglycerate mutase|nr:cofactor-independent phosphoglycerate mutase [Prolixibacteraceae bacterium]NLS98734.1 cofactor-independent phosphoglycerate mutase [Bacteroidales bacterium]OQB81980.1 MAG: cofactor-independent phosphoglycerate mutase [Bacteroidetes bacterium ADurb.Bin123]HNU77812.1 cofactor-independent phosphoglycerate mutase [Prolixibacteraceae bacterium]HNZ69530.1 cofactor-independent phosphoglycerate mutase [Prolixibacteraceae bacterium]